MMTPATLDVSLEHTNVDAARRQNLLYPLTDGLSLSRPMWPIKCQQKGVCIKSLHF